MTTTKSSHTPLQRQILAHASELPEGAVLHAGSLKHQASATAVTEAMQALAAQGLLARVCQGIYVRPIKTRFGPRSPDFETVIPELSALWGHTIVPSGGASANVLGLTTQVPVRPVYMTSGPNRTLRFGNLAVELRHAPMWQLTSPNKKTGDAIRALAWLGPQEKEQALHALENTISVEDLLDTAASSDGIPEWITSAIEARAGSARHSRSHGRTCVQAY